MKLNRKPLTTQIWLIFGFTFIFSLLLMSIIPWVFRGIFTPTVFRFIEKSQTAAMDLIEADGLALEELPYTEVNGAHSLQRRIEHLLLFPDGRFVSHTGLPTGMIDKLTVTASLQDEKQKSYQATIDGQGVFYSIRKIGATDSEVYLVSYMWDFYGDEFIQGLFFRFLLFMGLILLLCWLPSIFLARYLSRPLVQLERHVKQIADREWRHPVQVERSDEIGSLAASIERMRQKLVQQDEVQQSFLQHISHELKTPVMVIRSYTQSIKDGLFPKGDLASTVEVIESESERLEKRIQDLLCLTRLDYLSTHEPKRVRTDLKEALEDVIKRFRWRRGEVQWSVDLEAVTAPGSREEWTVVYENILDNQLRHARKKIEATLSRRETVNGETVARVRLWNDGPSIDEEVMSNIFKKYKPGPGGELGLGMSIVQRIVSLYEGRVWVENEHTGVALYIEVPLPGIDSR